MDMQGSRRMRLDLRGFQKEKKAGLLLVALVAAGALVAALLLSQEQGIANYYMSVDEYAISSSSMLEKIIGSSAKPVAVMFESPTCPTCKQMHPYWAVLERRSNILPVQFYHIVFSPATEEAFRRYRVIDTPTFIVFVGGQPVARHVGAFGGDNITDTMLNWALFSAGLSVVSDPQKLAEEGLRIFNNRCSSCHGRIAGLDRESLKAWLDSRRGEPDLLSKRLAEALEKNMTLRELYGSYGAISDAVKTMRKYIPDLTSYEIDRISYLLDYASAVLEGKEPPAIIQPKPKINATAVTAVQRQEAPAEASVAATSASIVGALAALAAGIVAAFSPCVLPLLVTYVSVVGASGRALTASRCIACGVAAFAGVIAIGVLFVSASSLAASIQSILLPVVAAAVIAAGVASILGVPVELEGIVSARRGGLTGFCAVYGFLAVQCNLPLVAGALLLAAGIGSTSSGLLVAASFAAGVSIPLAAAVYAAGRLGGSIVNRIMGRYTLLSRVGGLILVAAGVYLLAYSLQLI
ncbi:hypothetical protein PABY_02440 [Pyrodictium abyssi]|uniref:Uncharacterized protein n=2 Tax=Pyrodictium abyssi TaxID=54256 RepID=A0ABM8IWX7_9CREN|nr:hypothetical protein PABY_02440 [Pyrodictium abyssi]